LKKEKGALFYFQEIPQCKVMEPSIERFITQYGFSSFLLISMVSSETFASPPFLRVLVAFCSQAFKLELMRIDKTEVVHAYYRSIHKLNKVHQWTNVDDLENNAYDQRISELAKLHGLRTGIIVPLYDYSGNRFMVRLAGDRDAVSLSELDIIHNDVLDLFDLFLKIAQECNRAPGISARETEIIKWSADGKTSDEIAAILGISKFTVERHLKASIQRLGCSNKVELVYKAVKYGII
jgi:DNA-binding CsgD family transcriptional regulator